MKISALSGLFITLYFPAIQSFAGWYDAEFQPRVEMEYKITLSSAMGSALKVYDPEFEIWSAQNFHPMLRGLYEYKSFEPWRSFLAYQTPSAVIGDFNGDDIPDVILLGHSKTHGKRIVVLSNNTGYFVIEFTEKYPLTDRFTPNHKIGEGNIEECLELIPPGKIKAEPAYNRPEIDLKTDAFKFGNFEGSKAIYYYDKGKFIDYALSD